MTRSKPSRSAAQVRVLNTAFELFGEFDVSGTSLQMIADRIGVTKAAVYHQFKTKDEIVLAVAELELEGLAAALAAAEAETDRERAVEVLLRHVINLAIERRHLVATAAADASLIRIYPQAMCRNIKPLNNFEPPATDDEIRAAALQFVRKISGTVKPAQSNEHAWQHAVDDIAVSAQRLLESLVTSAPPKNREIEAAKARARSIARFGS